MVDVSASHTHPDIVQINLVIVKICFTSQYNANTDKFHIDVDLHSLIFCSLFNEFVED